MKIFLVGPQGSGKSTQGEILAKRTGYPLINTGELIREFVEEDTEEGREAREMMEQGQLIDNRLSSAMVRKKVARFGNDFIIDGFPRSMEQLALFDPEYDKVVCLDLSDEEAQKRLMPRGREDDTPEAIAERLAVYHQQTEPVLEHYQQEGKLIRVDASKSIEEIAQEIERKLQVPVND